MLRAPKCLFGLKDVHNDQSLGQYYLRRYGHLIPSDVELWEFDAGALQAECIHGR